MRSFHIHIRFTIGSMAVWLGILFLTAAGMGFFLSNSRHRAAKPAIATLIGDQAKPSLPGSESDTPDSTPDLAKHVANGDMHVHRTGLHPPISRRCRFLPCPPDSRPFRFQSPTNTWRSFGAIGCRCRQFPPSCRRVRCPNKPAVI